MSAHRRLPCQPRVERLEDRALLSYAITDLGTLGGASSQAFGINNLGQVVGQSSTQDRSSHAFLWDPNDGMQDLGALTDTGTSSALGINDAGQIIGWSSFPGAGSGLGFFWDAKNGMQALPPLPGNASDRPFAINQKGQIAGWSGGLYYLDGHATLWDGDTVTNLDPDDSSNVARGLNDNGQIVGAIGHPLGDQAFLWDNGKLAGLGALDNYGSNGFGINDLGQATGSSLVMAAPGLLVSHAFLYTVDQGLQDIAAADCSGGAFAYGTVSGINNESQIVGVNGCVSFAPIHDESGAAVWDPVNGWQNLQNLIPPNSGWTLFQATAINDGGQIVGYGQVDGKNHAFLLDPAPGGRPFASRGLQLTIANADRLVVAAHLPDAIVPGLTTGLGLLDMRHPETSATASINGIAVNEPSLVIGQPAARPSPIESSALAGPGFDLFVEF